MAPDESPTEIFDSHVGELLDADLWETDHDVDDPEIEYDDEDEDDRAEPRYLGYAEDEDGDEWRPSGRRRKTGKRFVGWLAALGVLVLLGGGAYYGARELLGFHYADYDGSGESDVVLEVEDGDSISAMAGKLVDLDVVASAKAFVQASKDEEQMQAVQPGYYVLPTEISGADAASRLVSDESQVGQLEVRAGTQLDDVVQPDDSVTPGVFSLLSEASCADLNGTSTCVSADELRETADAADLAELGLPDWAANGAEGADAGHALEGLIAAGTYQVHPEWEAEELLSEVLRASTTRLEAAGLDETGEDTPDDPYQVLTIASLVEKEGVEADFEQVARVIHNRIDETMPLQFDSTINYVLERPEVRTTAEDRGREGSYNTYLNEGLPPTPISVPSPEAIDAAENPAESDDLFFVKCEENGLSCFAQTLEEHQRHVEDAQDREIY